MILTTGGIDAVSAAANQRLAFRSSPAKPVIVRSIGLVVDYRFR